ELVMRGHLLCTECGERMTGSGSKGNGGRYLYYHCHHCKCTRFRAERAHAAFESYLEEVRSAKEVRLLFEAILEELIRSESGAAKQKAARLRRDITEAEERLFRTDEALIEGKIAVDSYERLKGRYSAEIERLRFEMREIETADVGAREEYSAAVALLSDLPQVWRRADACDKHELMVRIFPDRLRFQDGSFRTSPKSEIIAL